jgi:triacylglycerol lipase
MTFLQWALAIVIVTVVLFQLLCFVVALYETLNQVEARDVRLTGAGLLGALGAFALETLAVIGFVLALPLGWLPWRRMPRLALADAPPIVFVPGWAMNRACFLVLRHRLRHDGWPHALGVNYRTLHGDLLEGARRVQGAVEALCTATGAAHVILIGHSMGGIVCRAYLRYLGGMQRVTKVITLASPHRGSKLYALSLDPMVQDMREGSAFLHDLGDDDPIPGAVDFTAIYPSFDTLVVPAAQAYYPGVGNIEVEGVGHMGLLWSRRVYQLIRENLEYAPERPAAAPYHQRRPPP